MWPHEQTISVLLAIPSQWALQYFELPSAGQLQAALAHFLELAMILLYRSPWRFGAADRFDREMQNGLQKVVRSDVGSLRWFVPALG